MSMTDPIADLLTRIRNGIHARRDQVEMPWSRQKEAVARVAAEEGFLKECSVEGEGSRRTLRVVLRYDEGGRSVISGLRRVSRPSLRVYVGAKEIAPVRRGYGVSILSTPAGVLADREARKRNVGGEVLCSIW